jgi:hypothetical protein
VNLLLLSLFVQAPVLLVDGISGVRILEERWTFEGESSYWRDVEYRALCKFCQEYFLIIF